MTEEIHPNWKIGPLTDKRRTIEFKFSSPWETGSLEKNKNIIRQNTAMIESAAAEYVLLHNNIKDYTIIFKGSRRVKVQP